MSKPEVTTEKKLSLRQREEKSLDRNLTQKGSRPLLSELKSFIYYSCILSSQKVLIVLRDARLVQYKL